MGEVTLQKVEERLYCREEPPTKSVIKGTIGEQVEVG